MKSFTQDNTVGYSDKELFCLNAEWEEIVILKELEPDTDEYDLQEKWFSDSVSKR